MSEMIKRVTAALSERLSRYGISQTGTIERDIARAVVSAMRNPTQDMIMAGIIERHDQPIPEAWNLATENIYRAMIDAALGDRDRNPEGEKPQALSS